MTTRNLGTGGFNGRGTTSGTAVKGGGAVVVAAAAGAVGAVGLQHASDFDTREMARCVICLQLRELEAVTFLYLAGK